MREDCLQRKVEWLCKFGDRHCPLLAKTHEHPTPQLGAESVKHEQSVLLGFARRIDPLAAALFEFAFPRAIFPAPPALAYAFNPCLVPILHFIPKYWDCST